MLRRPAWLALAAFALAAAGQGVVGADIGATGDGVTEDARPWLGISYGRDGVAGILVTNVFEESAAIACGLRIGDEIIEVDGVPTPPGSDLSPLIQTHAISDRLTLTVLRGDRVVMLRPVLSRRLSEAELLHVQLVGRPAPAFDLVQPSAPDDDPIDDSALEGKVAVLAWFHTACSTCAATANQIAPWVDSHRGAVGLVGIGGRPNDTVETLLTTAKALLQQTPILLPVGVDPEGWLRYGVLEDFQNKLAVVVVDRQGIVQIAAAIASPDDPALDDVLAAAERALKPVRPKKPRR